MIYSTGRKNFKCGEEGQPASYCPEENNKDSNKKEHRKGDGDKYRASRLIKSSKSEISRLKRKTKKTFATKESNIDELGDKDSNITSSDSEDISGNSHFQFYNNPASFTWPRKFKTDREDYINIPGVTTPTGVVLHQEFE